ncbi:hypothetical protein [Campylobacter sp.]|uniref:hypothetical protein n=1 Tax=Campylobacter sp. TaxID=205 RepID=UPI002A80109C|nr:hypothetical protein [Campylobacter sp.]MDY4445754.1 hypothetical protein [Campylobacter sp.]
MDNLNELLKNYESKTAKIDKNYFYVDKEQVIKEINKQRAKPLARSLEFLEKYKHKKGYESEKQFYTRLYKAKSFNVIKEGDPLLARLAHHTKQGDFFAMLQITKYQDKKSQTNAIQNIKFLQDLKVKFYQSRLNYRHKGGAFSDFLADETITLGGVDFSSYSDIEQNIYYALDGTDFVLEHTLKEPQKAQIGSFTARFFGSYKFPKEIKAQKINHQAQKDILIKTSSQIPLNSVEASTALLYLLYHQRNTNKQGTYAKGYKYRKFIVSIIQDYLYSNLILESYYNKNKLVSTKIKGAKSQNIAKPQAIEKFLNIWIKYRFFIENS